MKKARSILQPILWTVFGLLAVLIFSFFLLPKVVSTPKGKELILNYVNRMIPGKISAESFDLNWFSGQTIKKFSFTDPEGKEIFRFDFFSTDETLFSALIHRWNLGETEFHSPFLYLEENKEGELNIHRALGIKKDGEKTKAKSRFKIPKFKGHILVTNGEMTVIPEKITPITLSQINLEAKDSFSFFRMSAKTKQGTEEGEMLASGDLGENLHVLASIHKFPVSLMDQFRETTVYESALGSYVDLDLELQRRDGTLTFNSKVVSPNLNGNITGLTSEGYFHLDQGEIIFTVTPLFFKNFFQTKEWELANRPQLNLTLEKLVIPLELKKPDLRTVPFKGKMTLERLEMTHTKIGAFSLNNFEANIVSLENLDVTYSAKIQGKGEATNINGKFTVFPDESVTFSSNFKALPTDVLELIMAADYPYLHKVLGEQFSLTIDGKYNERIDTHIFISTSNFEMEGTLSGDSLADLDANMNGEWIVPIKYQAYIGPNPKLELKANLSYHDRNLIIPRLSVDLDNPNLKVDVLGKFGEKGKPFNYKDTKLVINGKLFHLPLYRDVLDYKGTFVFEFEGAQNELLGKAILSSSPLAEQSIVVSLTAKEVVKNNELKIDQADIYLSGKINNFPLHFFDQLFDFKVKLYPLLGPHLDLETLVHYTPNQEHLAVLNLEAKSQGFFTQLAISLNEKLQIQQNKPALVHWEISEPRYKYLVQLLRPGVHPEFTLIENADLDLIIEKINCPTVSITGPRENFRAFFCEAGFTGSLNVTPLFFYNARSKEKVVINNIKGSVSSENFAKAFSFNMNSNIETNVTPGDKKSGFSAKIDTLNLLTKEGKINKEQLTVKGDLTFDLIPVKAMTEILPVKPENKIIYQALLGELVNAHIFGEISKLSGPLTIDIKSSNFNAILPLYFTKDALLLTKDVEVDLRLTEEINHVLLKDVTPILISGAWSDHPIKLKIASEGFYAHLRPFSLAGLYIENGMIDLGRITVRNGGQILSLAKFLKAQNVTDEGIMEAWFTPIYVSLKEGVATYNRFDALLAGNIHIAMWGGIDLLRDRVRMTLGISSDTLKQNLNLRGIAKQEMFQVKMRGSTSDLEIDWSAAYTRMVILTARSSGGQIGNIIGGIIEQLVGVLGDENTPPPTTYPFPWEIPTQ